MQCKLRKITAKKISSVSVKLDGTCGFGLLYIYDSGDIHILKLLSTVIRAWEKPTHLLQLNSRLLINNYNPTLYSVLDITQAWLVYIFFTSA